MWVLYVRPRKAMAYHDSVDPEFIYIELQNLEHGLYWVLGFRMLHLQACMIHEDDDAPSFWL